MPSYCSARGALPATDLHKIETYWEHDLHTMSHFIVKGYNVTIFVEKTPTGVKVDGQEHELDDNKVMEHGLHIYTLNDTIELGKDYYPWRMGATSFDIWSQRLNKPADQWEDEEIPTKFLIEDTVYDVENADRSWPMPVLRLDGEIVGVIDAEVNTETGATVQKVKWISVK